MWMLPLAAGVLALTACTPGAPAPTTSATNPTESATPAPTDDARPLGSRPDPRTEAGCGDLLDPAAFAGAFPAAIAPVDETRTAERIGTVITDGWYVRQAGGLLCEWQDAGSEVGSEGYFDYHGIRMLLFPATLVQWEPVGAAEASGGRRFTDCAGSDFCHFEAFTGDWWLSLNASGILDGRNDAVLARFEEVLTRVSALPAPRPAGASGSGDLVPELCEDQLTGPQLLAATGASGSTSLESGYPSPYPSLWATARESLGGTECSWGIDGSYALSITVLPGGAWALDIAADAYGEATPVAIPGTTDGGVFRPQVEGMGLGFAYDGDWIQVVTYEGAFPRPGNDVLVSVAAAIVANSE